MRKLIALIWGIFVLLSNIRDRTIFPQEKHQPREKRTNRFPRQNIIILLLLFSNVNRDIEKLTF